MQINGVSGERHPHEVAYIDAQRSLETLDMHVVSLNRKLEFARSFQEDRAENLIRLRRIVHVVCNFYHGALEQQIAVVNGSEDNRNRYEYGEDQQSRDNAPGGDAVHERSPESLLGAQSSSQMSSECGVHSVSAHSASPTNSSSFNVP